MPVKKLIEVALPLEAINKESAREKSIRHGHPSTLHLWWARRPLAACRAVIFASLVDDPSSHPEIFITEKEQETERQRLFGIIEKLVKWENVNNEYVLDQARAEIMKSTGGNPPPLLDPFAGGGSIPLEAQRLGLEAHAGDLNPVAVLINKALIEIPPRFAGKPPVNPDARKKLGAGQSWKGAAGLAEDVRYYGEWMRAEAEKRIGHLYPKAKLKDGTEATVIAWIWARTVKCPNPACGAEMPLVSSYWLSKKKYKEAWLEPQVSNGTVEYTVVSGKALSDNIVNQNNAGTGFVERKGKKTKATFLCPVCHAGIAKGEYIDHEANEGRMEQKLLAIVVDGSSGRIYTTPDESQFHALESDLHSFICSKNVFEKKPNEPCRGTFASNAQGRRYGFNTFGDYFTPRQLTAISTFSELVQEAKARVISNMVSGGSKRDVSIAESYSEAVAIYLAFALDKGVNLWSSVTSWMNDRGAFRETFARQAIPMVWDFAEANPFSESGGNISMFIERICDVITSLPTTTSIGEAQQIDATKNTDHNGVLISTDPPYYDNIGYADLSDFFYVWLRRSLQGSFSSMFGTVLSPKSDELIASPYRFNGDKDAARVFFESGMKQAFINMRQISSSDYPITVYYAFKQSENDDETDDQSQPSSSGWDTMLQALIDSGYLITGTWPMRTESEGRAIAQNSNALASSIVLVCRPRSDGAPVTTRQDFQRELRRSIRKGLHDLQSGNIAPVDLAQASIGPGMAVFTKYKHVLESDGTPMRVRTALQIINQELDAFLTEQEGDLDAESRFCVTWFEQYGLNEGPFGEAQVLATAKAASMDELVHDGVLYRQNSKVRLLTRGEIPEKWEAMKENTVWTVTQHLVKSLEHEGEVGAAKMLADLTPSMGENAKALAYRMFQLCERKNLASEALGYNALVLSWPEIQRKADAVKQATPVQTRMEGI